MAKANTVSKARYSDGSIKPDTYVYRDIEFRLNKNTPHGYYNRYTLMISRAAPVSQSASSQYEVKHSIDRYLVWKEEQEAKN